MSTRTSRYVSTAATSGTAERIGNQEGGRDRPLLPASAPRNQVDGATTISAMTVSLIHSSTVCRKLLTIISTPIMMASPTIKADTVPPLRPGFLRAWLMAIFLRTPPTCGAWSVVVVCLLLLHPMTYRGARQDK